MFRLHLRSKLLVLQIYTLMVILGLEVMQRPRLRFLLTCLITVILAASMIAFGIRRFRRPERSNAYAQSRAAEDKSQSEQLAVSLRAQTLQIKSKSRIRLRWDASAKPIRRSSYGILYIYDGGIPHKRLLKRRALDFGSTDYSPTSDEVTFHLVLEKGRSEGESVLVLLGTREGLHAGWESDVDTAARDPRLVPAKH